MASLLTFDDIEKAQKRIGHYAHITPVLSSKLIDEMVGATVHFKCENFQKTGAFKFRGATNAVFSLSNEDADKGVITHSSGNFAAALSLAARNRAIPARIMMPKNAPAVKVSAVKGYGGEITFCDSDPVAREEMADQIRKESGATFVHPSNDLPVIAGQGTAGLELIEAIPDLDLVLTPVGGGGLVSGTALAVKGVHSKTQVIGCEPANADDAYRSLQIGEIQPSNDPDTIADGLRTSLGSNTFPLIQKWVDDIVLVTEEEIIQAMRLIYERMKLVIEPSSAVPVAALLFKKVPVKGNRVGIILSGGNVDFNSFFDEWQAVIHQQNLFRRLQKKNESKGEEIHTSRGRDDMSVKITYYNDIAIVSAKANLMGGKETEEYRDTVKELVSGGNNKIVADLTKVKWINSKGLGMLMACFTSCKNAEGDFKVMGATEKVRSLLMMTKLLTIFDAFDNMEDAVASF